MKIDRSTSRAIAATALVLGFLVFSVYLVARELKPISANEESIVDPNDEVYPGHFQPRALTAAESTLADNVTVVGVVIGGKARAYRLSAMAGPRTHVINDLLAERPITVTYCTLHNCIRVFAGDGKEPIDMANGGYSRGLLLLLNGKRYRQDDGVAVDGAESKEIIPLAQIEFSVTTWKAWREAHPDTEVVNTLAGSRTTAK